MFAKAEKNVKIKNRHTVNLPLRSKIGIHIKIDYPLNFPSLRPMADFIAYYIYS